MRLNGFDLNQLVCLEALLSEGSVTRAANKLHLSQSAMSAILAQLREHFGDPLLAKSGRGLVPTPFARGLLGPVNALMSHAREFIAHSPAGDLASVDRTLQIVASDYMLEVGLANAIGTLTAAMPNLRFDILPLTENSGDLIRSGSVDLLLAGQAFAIDQAPNLLAFEDRFVCLTCANQGIQAGALNRDIYNQSRHVVVRYFEHQMTFEDDEAMRRQGIRRPRRISVWSYSLVPHFIRGTKMIATVTERVAEELAQRWPVAIHPFPFEQDPIRIYGYWHPSRDGDLVLREIVKTLNEDMTARSPSPPPFEAA